MSYIKHLKNLLAILTGFLLMFFYLDQAFGEVTVYELPGKYGKISASGEMTWRYEYRDWFDVKPGFDNQYGFAFQRTRLGLKYEQEFFDVFLQGEYVHLFNLPGRSVAPPPAGPLDLGAVYRANNPSQGEEPHKVFIKQVYLDVKDPLKIGFSARVGRFDYKEGLEVTTTNPKINTVKASRLAERLIGPFGFSAVTRSFDGALFKYDDDMFNVTAGVIRPTQGGFNVDGGRDMKRLNLVVANATLKESVLIPNTELRAFYIYYDDDRNVTQRVDNTAAVASDVDIQIHTLGFHAVGAYPAGPGELDFLLWGAGQFGGWYELNQRSYAGAVEAGYQLKNLPWKPWLRTGIFASTGDGDPKDGDHETFFQILPTARLYARFPIYNLMNNKDLFSSLILAPVDGLTIRSDWRFIWLTRNKDLWYSGAGASKEEGMLFGYSGRPSGGRNYLGNLLDIQANYQLFKFLGLEAYYAHFFGGSVVDATFNDKSNADFFYLQAVLSF